MVAKQLNALYGERTLAQEVARMFGDDGTEFFLRDPQGEPVLDADGDRYHLIDVAQMLGADVWNTPSGAWRYQFHDGSSIIEATGGWDLGIAGSSEDCRCWDGADHGQHADDCPDVKEG